MKKELEKANKAFLEISKLIADAEERGQFNLNYFEEPFKLWFAQKMDEAKDEDEGGE